MTKKTIRKYNKNVDTLYQHKQFFSFCLFYSTSSFSTTLSPCPSHITLLQAISSSSSQLQFTTASQFSTYISSLKHTMPSYSTTHILGTADNPIILHNQCPRRSVLLHSWPPPMSYYITHVLSKVHSPIILHH